MRLPIACLVLLLSLFSGAGKLTAQQFSVSGYVYDAATGEALPGATLAVPEKATGAYSNNYGYYRLSLPSDSVRLLVTFSGLETKEIEFFLSADTSLDIRLGARQDIALNEVLITDDAGRELLERNQMSVEKLSIDLIRDIPAFMGEVDVLKTVQLLPGVQSGNEGSTGLHVRGGAADQNLILLDDAPVYNSGHLFGFFSIFNGDAVSNLELYKGAFPAQYGGRLSSVLDVKMKEGNQRKLAVTGGIGLIASRLTVEGPILKDRASFMVSGRRTYVDLFTRQANRIYGDRENWETIPDYYFYDLNTKLNFKAGKKDRFFLSGYFGNDVFQFESGRYSLNFNWGNATGSARWNHLFSDNLFMKTTAIYSHFKYNIQNEYSIFEARIFSTVDDLTLKTDFDFFPNNKHFIRFGYHHTYHTLTPRSLSGEIKATDFELEAGKYYYGTESALYFSDDISLSSRTKLNIGLRMSGFLTKNATYFNPEPRISFLFRAREDLSLKASYSRMTQYIHLLSNSAVSLPTDLWFPTTDQVKPGITDQTALGMTWVGENGFEINWEAFGKYYQRQSEFMEGTQVFVPESLDSSVVQGIGWSYGTEILFRKRIGKFSGWLGYTLSWSWRQIDELNGGRPYPNKYDRRHDISAVASWEISPKFTLAGTWVFGTGNAVTLAPGRFFISDFFDRSLTVIPDYVDRNSFRMPAYHRLDLGLTWNLNPEKDRSTLNFSVFNAYNRRNTYFIYYEEIWHPDGYLEKIVAKKVSLFPILPSVTWNFKF